ncbi:MAG TPA: hypothetical protein VHK69_05075 [Chitinophagaceae bacterium]|jgi:hypothetical protein|nr:hypothetical protein [Chitinophagaceae bacterium]
MQKNTLQLCGLWAALFWSMTLNAQRTFHVNREQLTALDFGQYTCYLIDTSFDLKRISRQIRLSGKFLPDSAQIAEAEKALKMQYYSVRVQALDQEWEETRKTLDKSERKIAARQRRKSRPALLASFKRIQEQELAQYDRYYYGYVTEGGERLLLILFDPHQITYFTIANETHISNLPAMFYTIDSQELVL